MACTLSLFSVNNSLEDIYITAVFGVLGYAFMRLKLDPAPLMLGFILGPMLEENFRRAMLLSRGSFDTFVSRPISLTLFTLIAVFVAWQVVAFGIQTSRRRSAEAQP